jgi:hypothetical protein
MDPQLCTTCSPIQASSANVVVYDFNDVYFHSNKLVQGAGIPPCISSGLPFSVNFKGGNIRMDNANLLQLRKNRLNHGPNSRKRALRGYKSINMKIKTRSSLPDHSPSRGNV